MPLPPALAAKLAKRGLLKKVTETPPSDPSGSEEVIAESYDDDNPQLSSARDEPYDPATLLDHHDDADVDSGPLIHECVNCPNRSNVYHNCVPYCRQRWGLKTFSHDPDMDKKRERLLRRYPIPLGCVEVADPETGRYYYWNTETDEVSWLPPQHPRASISLPQEKLKELMESAVAKSQPSKVGRAERRDDSDVESDENSTDLDDEEDDLDEEEDVEQVEKEVIKRKKQSEQDRGVVKKRRDVKLDPMDPSAYSDVPKGNWSTGLELKGAAKTGADVTAAGPLFQQRPYPSPGAILRMNEGKK